MGVLDSFGREDRVEVRFSVFYNMMYEAAKEEIIENAINAKVPIRYIRDMLAGQPESEDENNA